MFLLLFLGEMNWVCSAGSGDLMGSLPDHQTAEVTLKGSQRPRMPLHAGYHMCSMFCAVCVCVSVCVSAMAVSVVMNEKFLFKAQRQTLTV